MDGSQDSIATGMSAERLQRISEIRSLLQSGVTTMTVDGETTSFDHNTLRRELRLLEEAEGIRRPKQKVTNIYLG